MKLNDLMEFGHVIEVHADGSVTEPRGIHGPETVYQELDKDGQCIDDEIHGLPSDWSLMTAGYTGQYSYSGPVMHTSEFIGGRLERDILATPGFYVAVIVDGLETHNNDSEDTNIGWAVAYKESQE
jgi:hypothetical protein